MVCMCVVVCVRQLEMSCSRKEQELDGLRDKLAQKVGPEPGSGVPGCSQSVVTL
jgi:hypothetical protein